MPKNFCIEFVMFQANNLTYQRRREKEKKATRRAIAKAEARRQKMEELMAEAQDSLDRVALEEGEDAEEGRKHTEFFDVCNNLQKTDEVKKKRHRKVVAASD